MQMSTSTRMWELPKGIYLEGFTAGLEGGRAQLPQQHDHHGPGGADLVVHRLDQRLHLCQVALPRRQTRIFILFLVGMFLPYQGILIPLVLTLQAVGLYGTMVGLIMVHCIFGIPITALLFRGYYAGIPNELLDAAKIDGCGFFGIYR